MDCSLSRDVLENICQERNGRGQKVEMMDSAVQIGSALDSTTLTTL